VLGDQLGADQQRRAERRHLRRCLAAGTEGDEHRKRPHRDHHRDTQRLQRMDLAPDAERGVAIDLGGDCAVPEGDQAGVDDRLRHHDGPHDDEAQRKPQYHGSCRGGRARGRARTLRAVRDRDLHTTGGRVGSVLPLLSADPALPQGRIGAVGRHQRGQDEGGELRQSSQSEH